MSAEGELVTTKFNFGRKIRARKVELNVDFEKLKALVHELFPELENRVWELTYGEYSIDSADDWEGAIEEFRSSKSGYWFPLEITDPNAPPPNYPVFNPQTQIFSSAPPTVPPRNNNLPANSVPTSNPSKPSSVISGASYTPHKHLGQMTPDQRLLHKIVWAHQQLKRPVTVFDIREVLPKGKKKPNGNKITQLMSMGIQMGYFQLHPGNTWTLGTQAIPFDSFC